VIEVLRPDPAAAAQGAPPRGAILGRLLAGDVAPAVPARAAIPSSARTLERRIAYMVTKAIHDYGMIVDGDKLMVCMSGGKDSYAMLHFLQRAQRKAPIDFEILAVHLDQGQPGFPTETLEAYLQQCGSPYHIVREHTYDIVMEKLAPGKTTCSLCSRLRRGILYDAAQKLGCTKVALGHHRDDVLATFLLNVFFCGQLKAMPPVLRAEDGYNTVIRPLTYVPEEMIKAFVRTKEYPLLPCRLCDKQPDLKRAQMETLLREIDGLYPGALPSALHAMKNVHPRFLMDNKAWNFDNVVRDGSGDADREADAFS
jgi:tRNA 2-thiocytidine biosynthesis protein TtcA